MASQWAAMRRSAALTLLSPVHARVLELDEEGLGPRSIATELDVEPESVALLLTLAKAKLAALEGLPEPRGDSA
jgi:orotate phosphoribosyltransferase-like protein